MGSTLHIIDFLIQNMTAQGLNKQTNPPGPIEMSGKNTALHLCALHDRRECMKLLLRSGCDCNIRNSQNKLALDIAKEMGNEACKELIEHAMKREKSAFDHINTDWNIHDDGSTDFSDDDTALMDERKSRSRPPSFVGGDSPVALRSRSSTCDSIQSGSSPSSSCNPNAARDQRQIPPIPSSGTSPKQFNTSTTFSSHYTGGSGGSVQNSIGMSGVSVPSSGSSPISSNSSSTKQGVSSSHLTTSSNMATYNASTSKKPSSANVGSLKKRTAPAPPPTTYGTLPHAPRHSQNLENELFGISSQNVVHGLHHHHPDMYSTLPHFRGSDPVSNSSTTSVPATVLSSEMRGGSTKSMQAQILFDNKIFDRYEPYASTGTAANVGSGSRDPNFLSTFTGAGAKLVLPPAGEIPQLKPVSNRPKQPIPSQMCGTQIANSGPSPSTMCNTSLDGILKETAYGNSDTSGIRSNTLDNSITSSSGGNADSSNSSFSRNDNSGGTSSVGLDSFNLSNRSFGGALRRCRALYDCNADNDDELEFKEGEILIVLNERTDDENWMEGQIEGDSTRRGMFPVSFVQMMDN
uniref:SH3 domain-containing protein n=1 Tax=Anopheles epiroticus TaxID=199890 RepID=A0A182P4F6_9DIPT